MTQLALSLTEMDDLAIVRRKVVLPFLPPSKNVYDKWQPMWRSGARDKWFRHLAERFDELQFPQNAQQVAVAFRLWFPSRARRDWQNYAPLLLHVVPDALVRYGTIPDDTPQYFTVGANAGIEFAYDDRKFVNVKDRRRTEMSFAIRR